MSEAMDQSEAGTDAKRGILRRLLDEAKATAYANTVQAEAGRAAAKAIERLNKADADSLRNEATVNDRKAASFRAAAIRYAELLAELPEPAPEPVADGPALLAS